MKFIQLSILLLSASTFFAPFIWAQKVSDLATKPFEILTDTFIVEPPTLICAGFEWIIRGDENRDASVSVEYRSKGEKIWQEALPLLRIGGEKVYGHEQRWVYTVPQKFVGSIFNLEPGTIYDCRFRVSDPDGVVGATEHNHYFANQK